MELAICGMLEGYGFSLRFFGEKHQFSHDMHHVESVW